MLLNTAQAAARLKIPVATVRRFAINGSLPERGVTDTDAGRERHHFMFDSADVTAFGRALVKVGRGWRHQPVEAPAPVLRAAAAAPTPSAPTPSAPPLPVLGLFTRLDAMEQKLDALATNIDRLLKLWS
jgi:hypothetical protein